MDRIALLFPLWEMIGSVLTFAHPGPVVDLEPWVLPLLGLVMFGMGFTLTVDQFREVLRPPGLLALGAAMQFGIALAAWWFGRPQPGPLAVVLGGLASPRGLAITALRAWPSASRRSSRGPASVG